MDNILKREKEIKEKINIIYKKVGLETDTYMKNNF